MAWREEASFGVVRADRIVKRDLVKSLTAATTLTYMQSGKILTLNLAAGFAVTLPAPKEGLDYTFIVGTAPTGAYTVVTNGSSNIIYGNVCTPEDAAGSVSVAQASDTITFVASKAVIGDMVRVVSDGTNWYLVAGMCTVQDGITVTQES